MGEDCRDRDLTNGEVRQPKARDVIDKTCCALELLLPLSDDSFPSAAGEAEAHPARSPKLDRCGGQVGDSRIEPCGSRAVKTLQPGEISEPRGLEQRRGTLDVRGFAKDRAEVEVVTGLEVGVL